MFVRLEVEGEAEDGGAVRESGLCVATVQP